ncbi:MAG: DUF3800 domain-containing protein [Solirubrobacteraceae bacterium]
MIFASDESGGFQLDRVGFEPSVWASVICPTSLHERVCHQVAAWCDAWGIEELHTRDLEDQQRLDVAGFIGGVDVTWTATVIDSIHMDAAGARRWRTDQLAKFEEDFAASETRGSMHKRYRGRGEGLRRLLSDERRVRLPQFVQFGIVAPKHVFDCAQGALRRYRDPSWAPDWAAQRLVFDRKDVRPEGGERLADATLYPILASMTLNLPIEFQLAGHPLAVTMKPGRGPGVSLLDFYGGDPTFEDSGAEPTIQLADFVAWSVRRRITHPNDAHAHALVSLLRPSHYRTGDLGFHLFMRTGTEFARSPYEHLL